MAPNAYMAAASGGTVEASLASPHFQTDLLIIGYGANGTTDLWAMETAVREARSRGIEVIIHTSSPDDDLSENTDTDEMRIIAEQHGCELADTSALVRRLYD